MRMLQVAVDQDLDGPGSPALGTAIDLAAASVKHPFKPGATVVAVISISAWLEAEQDAANLTLQGSEDDITYTDLLECAGSSQPFVMAEIVLPRYIRTSMESVTAGDGRGSVYLLGN